MSETTKVEIYKVSHQATLVFDLPIEEAVEKAIEFAEANKVNFESIPPRFMAMGDTVKEE